MRVNLDKAPYEIFPAVESSWGQVRSIQPDAIWNPRNGGWFTWTQHAATPPSPTLPTVPRDVWIQRMNEELAAVDKLDLNPAEKEAAREAIRKRYFGG